MVFDPHQNTQHSLLGLQIKVLISNLPTNQGFLRLFSTVNARKYSSNPCTGLACGCTDRVPSTSASFPSDTSDRALHPSDPIHEKLPVALFLRTARITPATS